MTAPVCKEELWSEDITKDASEGKENGPATDKVDGKPSKPQKPSKLRTDEDGKPTMDDVDMDQFREAAIKAGYEDVANYYSKKTDGNASFLRAARAGNLEKVLEYLKGSTDINTSNANGLNALHLSSKEGHLNIVTELLKRGADVNAATKKGNTALHIGALAGQEEIVKVLIEHGADVNVQSQNGFTPLYMAAQENHTGVVKYLLSNSADQNLATEDGFLPIDVATQQGHDVVVETLLQHSRPQYPQKAEDGFTPLAVALQQGHDKVVAVLLENDRAGKTRLPALHIAARKDDTKAAALLLQSGHNPDVTSKSGFTPLHIAAHYGHVNVATLLLQKGATVDYSARNHITPLHVAAKWGRVNMVNTLLDRGAKIDAKTRDGLTPLHCSARSGHDHCVDQLLERGAPISTKTKSGLAPLHMAAQGDHVDSARLLLFHKAPVDDVTVDYLTPLHVAAHCGHHRVAKLLLDRKATADARALNGFTPLHIACKKNRIKVIELLLKYGASIHATTESGLTPLHAAAFMGNVQIVPYLIKNGAKVNETNVRGETPLHLAARSNQIDVMKILIDNGATVDAQAHENQTPLHIAARLGNAEIVTLLLEKGANADAQTRDQYTALHIAAREGKEDVAEVLLDRGATLSMKTKKDFTPLHVAAKYGRLEVASLLLRKCAAPDAKAQNGLTPLHIAAHYDNVDVAMLLLDHGALPHMAAKNGFTPLHIAAKKNQMDVATTLLEYGADPNATTKHGISPVHLAALEGHSDMLSLLLERGAKPDIVSKNGLTPLHLAAQEDQLNCAVILVNSKAEIDPKTKAGYTPLHVACHYGNIKTATYLLEHNASVEEKTKHGLTPLHQGAQQGHVGIVNTLLAHNADPNEKANNGYTPLAIAKRLGYISVVNTLTIVTEETNIVISPNDEKLKVQVPETMQVNFMSDSDDEGDDVSMTGDISVLSPQEIRTMGDDSVTARKSWEDDWMREPNMNYFSGVGSLSGHYSMTSPTSHLSVTSPSGYSTLDSRYGGDRSINGDVQVVDGEAPIVASSEMVVESSAPMLESTPQRQTSSEADNEGPRSFPSFHGFLISFIVDARGGTMRSKRLPGLRLVVPPKRASGPTRVTCRLIKRTKLQTPPPLVDNEALSTRVIEVGPSNTQFLGGLGNKLVTFPPLNDGETMVSRILEMGPSAEKFLRPVLLEVPHFASLRGKEREIVVLRSDNGESWREHSLGATDEEVKKAMDGYEVEDNKVPSDKRICRIITKDFPQYFAIISRVRQETSVIGTQGGMLNSSVVPQVQAVFPEGTLTKKIKVGLQAQPVSNDVVKKVLGNRVMVSPIVTIEPRRRKFHKPITVTIPVPTAYNQGVNTYGGDTPTLRLLCSISGGTAPAQWEDITGTTPLTFVNDCVSFTTTVSARFWLMDCKEIDQASNFARELYQELKAVPFMSKFVVFAKTHDPIEARVRVFCVTDDKIDRPLEQKEEFKEVARSKDVEVMDGRPVYIELAGNLVPVQKSGEQLHLNFHAFHENRLPFFVRMRDQTQEPCGRLSFMREPRVQRGLPPQVPVCNLNVTMPAYVKVKKATDSESESESESEDEDYKMEKGEREQYHQTKEIYSLTKVEFSQKDILLSNLNFEYIKDKKNYTFPEEASRDPETAEKPHIILWDISNKLGSDWPALGRELGINDREIKLIENENDDLPEQAFVVLHLWAERQGRDATTSQLADSLQSIGRGDIVDQCLPEDKPLDVSVMTSRLTYGPLRGDLDSPRDGTVDITIDITGEEELGFEDLKQEISDEKDAGARSPSDDVTAKHAEIEELHSIESDSGPRYTTKTVTTTIVTKKVVSGSEVTPEELESVIQDQAKTEVSEKFVEELKEKAVKETIPEDINEQLEKHEKEQTEPGEKTEDINQSVTSRVVSVEQTRTVVTSKRVETADASGRPKEKDSESESSVDTAIFVDRPQGTTTTTEVKIRETLVSDSSSPTHRTEFMNNVSNVSYMAPEIQIDEAPTPERIDSEEENEYLPPTEEEVIAASEEQKTEGINPDLSMEPESVEDDDIPSPVVESDITMTTESTVQGINPDMQIGPDPLDSPGDLPSPEYQEGGTPTGAQAVGFGMSSEEELEPTITGRSIPDVAREATVQTITVQTKVETSSPDGEESITTFKKSEVTVSESALESEREFVGVAVTKLAEDFTPEEDKEGLQEVEDTEVPTEKKKQPVQQEVTTVKTKQKVVHFEEHVYVETGRDSLPIEEDDKDMTKTDQDKQIDIDDAVVDVRPAALEVVKDLKEETRIDYTPVIENESEVVKSDVDDQVFKPYEEGIVEQQPQVEKEPVEEDVPGEKEVKEVVETPVFEKEPEVVVSDVDEEVTTSQEDEFAEHEPQVVKKPEDEDFATEGEKEIEETPVVEKKAEVVTSDAEEEVTKSQEDEIVEREPQDQEKPELTVDGKQVIEETPLVEKEPEVVSRDVDEEPVKPHEAVVVEHEPQLEEKPGIEDVAAEEEEESETPVAEKAPAVVTSDADEVLKPHETVVVEYEPQDDMKPDEEDVAAQEERDREETTVIEKEPEVVTSAADEEVVISHEAVVVDHEPQVEEKLEEEDIAAEEEIEETPVVEKESEVVASDADEEVVTSHEAVVVEHEPQVEEKAEKEDIAAEEEIEEKPVVEKEPEVVTSDADEEVVTSHEAVVVEHEPQVEEKAEEKAVVDEEERESEVTPVVEKEPEVVASDADEEVVKSHEAVVVDHEPQVKEKTEDKDIAAEEEHEEMPVVEKEPEVVTSDADEEVVKSHEAVVVEHEPQVKEKAEEKAVVDEEERESEVIPVVEKEPEVVTSDADEEVVTSHEAVVVEHEPQVEEKPDEEDIAAEEEIEETPEKVEKEPEVVTSDADEEVVTSHEAVVVEHEPQVDEKPGEKAVVDEEEREGEVTPVVEKEPEVVASDADEEVVKSHEAVVVEHEPQVEEKAEEKAVVDEEERESKVIPVVEKEPEVVTSDADEEVVTSHETVVVEHEPQVEEKPDEEDIAAEEEIEETPEKVEKEPEVVTSDADEEVVTSHEAVVVEHEPQVDEKPGEKAAVDEEERESEVTPVVEKEPEVVASDADEEVVKSHEAVVVDHEPQVEEKTEDKDIAAEEEIEETPVVEKEPEVVTSDADGEVVTSHEAVVVEHEPQVDEKPDEESKEEDVAAEEKESEETVVIEKKHDVVTSDVGEEVGKPHEAVVVDHEPQVEEKAEEEDIAAEEEKAIEETPVVEKEPEVVISDADEEVVKPHEAVVVGQESLVDETSEEGGDAGEKESEETPVFEKEPEVVASDVEVAKTREDKVVEHEEKPEVEDVTTEGEGDVDETLVVEKEPEVVTTEEVTESELDEVVEHELQVADKPDLEVVASEEDKEIEEKLVEEITKSQGDEVVAHEPQIEEKPEVEDVAPEEERDREETTMFEKEPEVVTSDADEEVAKSHEAVVVDHEPQVEEKPEEEDIASDEGKKTDETQVVEEKLETVTRVVGEVTTVESTHGISKETIIIETNVVKHESFSETLEEQEVEKESETEEETKIKTVEPDVSDRERTHEEKFEAVEESEEASEEPVVEDTVETVDIQHIETIESQLPKVQETYTEEDSVVDQKVICEKEPTLEDVEFKQKDDTQGKSEPEGDVLEPVEVVTERTKSDEEIEKPDIDKETEVPIVVDIKEDQKYTEPQTSESIVESSKGEGDLFSEPLNETDMPQDDETVELKEEHTEETLVTVIEKTVLVEKTETSQEQTPEHITDESVDQRTLPDDVKTFTEQFNQQDREVVGQDVVYEVNRTEKVTIDESTQDTVVTEQMTSVHIHTQKTSFEVKEEITQEPGRTEESQVQPDTLPDEDDVIDEMVTKDIAETSIEEREIIEPKQEVEPLVQETPKESDDVFQEKEEVILETDVPEGEVPVKHYEDTGQEDDKVLIQQPQEELDTAEEQPLKDDLHEEIVEIDENLQQEEEAKVEEIPHKAEDESPTTQVERELPEPDNQLHEDGQDKEESEPVESDDVKFDRDVVGEVEDTPATHELDSEFVETPAEDVNDLQDNVEEQVPEDAYDQTRYFEELQNIPEEPEDEILGSPEGRVGVVHSESVRTVVTTSRVIGADGVVDEHTEVKVFKNEELVDQREDGLVVATPEDTLQEVGYVEEDVAKVADEVAPSPVVGDDFEKDTVPSQEVDPVRDETIQSTEVETQEVGRTSVEESVPAEDEVEIEMEAVEDNIKTEMTPDEEVDVFPEDDVPKAGVITGADDHFTHTTEVRVHTEITTRDGTVVHEERKVVEDGKVMVDYKMDTLETDDTVDKLLEDENLKDEDKQLVEQEQEDVAGAGPDYDKEEEDLMEDEEDMSSEEGEYMPEIRVDPSSEYVQPKEETERDENGLVVEPDPFTEESDVSLDEREGTEEKTEQDTEDVLLTSKLSITSTHIVDGTTVSHMEMTQSSSHEEQKIDSGQQPADERPTPLAQDGPEIIHDELLEQSIILESEACVESTPREEESTDRPKTPEIADITEHEEFSPYFQDQEHHHPVSDIQVPDADLEVEVPEISPEDDVEMDLPEPPLHPYVEDDGQDATPSHESYMYSSTTIIAPNVDHVRSDADWSMTKETTYTVTESHVEERISVPTDLNLDQSPSPQVDSVQTPEIQELPDTPDSIPESPLVGIYQSDRDQPIMSGEEEAAPESQPDDTSADVEAKREPPPEPDVAMYVDGPTESDYYDPSFIAQHAAHVEAEVTEDQEQQGEVLDEEGPQEQLVEGSQEEQVGDEMDLQQGEGEHLVEEAPTENELTTEEDQRLMAEAITIGVISAAQSTEYGNVERHSLEEEVISTEPLAEDQASAGVTEDDIKVTPAAEGACPPEDEGRRADDDKDQVGLDSKEDESPGPEDFIADSTSRENASVTTITTTRTVYRTSDIPSEDQKPSEEDEGQMSSDNIVIEGVQPDATTMQHTSVTRTTTTKTVYHSSSGLPSDVEGEVGSEQFQSIKEISMVPSSQLDEALMADVPVGEQTHEAASRDGSTVTTITTTRTVYRSSGDPSEEVELVDSIVKPKAPEEVEAAEADIEAPQEVEAAKVPDILKKTDESEAVEEGEDVDDVDSPTKPVAVPLGQEGATTTIVRHTYVVTRERRTEEPSESEALVSERQRTEPPVDESFGTPTRHGPGEESRPKMDPATVQELADLLNEVDEGEPSADLPKGDEETGPHVEEDDHGLSEQAARQQEEAPKVKLSPEDEAELQELWSMDWPQPGEKPISSNLAEKVESAPPVPQEESGPQEESAPPVKMTTYLESTPRSESSQQDQSAPPADDGSGGSLVINFNPGAQAPTGFNLTPEREKELQELWQEDTKGTDEQSQPQEDGDDGPQVQENMAPKGLPPSSYNQRKFELTEDDEKQLQQFWDEPPATQVEPQEQQCAPPQQHSAPSLDDMLMTPAGDAPFGDDDVKEEVEVEEFEEELPDGTIRKVIRKRIKRSTVQMVPIEVDPADLPPGGTHNIVVHKKVTKNTVVRDGKEVETSENVDTEIEQDGIVTDAADLREDLQQLVDDFLADGTCEGAHIVSDEQEVVDESDI